MDAYTRKLQNNLVTIGTGVVILSIWTLVKTILYGVVLQDYFLGDTPPEYTGIVIVIVSVIVIADFLLHSYIGLSARSEGKGKKKSIVYLIVSGGIVLLSSVIVLLELIMLFFAESGWLTKIISIIIDCTSMAFILDMMSSSIRLRKLNKKKEKSGEGAA